MSTPSFPPPPPPPPSQFGAPVFPQTTSSGQVLMSSSASPPVSVATSSPSSPCCDTGRPILMDPHTGQTICSCQYSPPVSGPTPTPGAPPPPGLLAAAYPRIPGLPEGLYNSPYAAAAAAAAAAASQGLMPLSDPSAFYPAMGAYDLKALAASSPMYAYDPNMGAYPYPNGFLDPNARRKNATRESTQTLKAWLAEHKKNPYPTKGEKIMLAIITKMTLTQVSTWFANARRRLKKENKMTWEPRNRADDEDDDDDKMDSDTERTDIGRADEDDDMEEIDIGTESDPEDAASRHISDSRRLMENLATTHALHSLAAAAAASAASTVISSPPSLPAPGLPHHRTSTPTSSPPASPPPSAVSPLSTSRSSPLQDSMHHSNNKDSVIKSTNSNSSSHNTSSSATTTTTKPKIWSMADIATSSHTSSSGPPSTTPPAAHTRPRSPPRIPLHAPRPPLHPGFPYSWPGLPYGLPPHLVPQVSTAALLSRYGLAMGTMGAMGAAPTMVTSSAASAFCRPPVAVAPGGERRELHATGVKSSSPAESSPAPLHTAFRPVPKSKPTQPIHV